MDDRPSGPMWVLLTLRFLAELGLLAALAWVGWHLSGSVALALPAAVLLPVLAAVVWARWVAPRATHRLRDPLRAGVELVLFFTAFVLLTRAEPHPDTVGWGLGLLLAYAVSLPARRVEV